MFHPFKNNYANLNSYRANLDIVVSCVVASRNLRNLQLSSVKFILQWPNASSQMLMLTF